MQHYTGVGSRNTPAEILQLITRIAKQLSALNYMLRSGGADGADRAFESGANGLCRIFYAQHATAEAMELASKFHPAWERCGTFAKRLHGRNSLQVLGPNLNEPSEFLICWTPDGCISHQKRRINTGGTGTAISIANAYNIPIHNLGNINHLHQWKQWLQT
jgi:hypothetical protein